MVLYIIILLLLLLRRRLLSASSSSSFFFVVVLSGSLFFLDIIGLDCEADPSPACLQDSQIPVFEITGKKSLENVSPQR